MTGREVFQLARGPDWHVLPCFHQYPFTRDGNRMFVVVRRDGIHANRAPGERFFVGDGYVDRPFITRLEPFRDIALSGSLPPGPIPEASRPA